ncbi:MAG: RNA methyltransferase [Dehalococcoidia bacterium]|nr:RNA methyltransferase [Dehalococcoidia bacterium]
MRQVLERRQDDLQALIEDVHDPHNASAILRSADGFGVGAVNLLYTREEFPEISKPVSAYTRKWMPVDRFEDPEACVEALHARGLRVFATHLDEGARRHLDIDWTQPSVIAFGNEHRGCSEQLLALADERVYIPMQGFAQSFNVSVSAAVIFAEAYRQRLAAGLYEPRWSEAKEALYQSWIARSGRDG